MQDTRYKIKNSGCRIQDAGFRITDKKTIMHRVSCIMYHQKSRASCIVHHDSKGFSLIETIMVMVIAVILAAVVAVRWSPFDTIKLNSATRKVAADIRYAQKVAISTQARAAIEFTGTGYNVYQNFASLILAPNPGDPCSDSGGNFRVDFSASRCSNFSSVTITPPATNPLYFNSLGTPVNAAGAAVGNQTVTVTYNGSSAITIEEGTGRVSIP
ncbi:MAG: prepilin-type N-terminal cleavage/methylation domain-containing protein [Nitrospiraceae bacterium]|nr:MAG: prepilin-type N-terminal cleavage/methylation domain-containing protein [Nitrospiraceae bacterium]